MPKIISKCCEMVKLCHSNQVFFETQSASEIHIITHCVWSSCGTVCNVELLNWLNCFE